MDRIEKLKSFIAQNPADLFSRHALAMEYLKAGDEAGAAALLEGILESDKSYIGSYYHLGKIRENRGDLAGAVEMYEKGMAEARRVGDTHAWNELRAAREAAAD
jgi:Tfp pilus assembly protein PilF